MPTLCISAAIAARLRGCHNDQCRPRLNGRELGSCWQKSVMRRRLFKVCATPVGAWYEPTCRSRPELQTAATRSIACCQDRAAHQLGAHRADAQQFPLRLRYAVCPPFDAPMVSGKDKQLKTRTQIWFVLLKICCIQFQDVS
jgi:hypothetical protein